jgi:hypothetical protein
MSWLVRLLGRRYNKTESVYSDQPVRVEQTYFHVGMLEAHLLLPSYQTGVTLMRTTWFMHAGGATSSPLILKKLEVCNPMSEAITFRMAIMATSTGAPGTDNAFLAWDTSVAPSGVWQWNGEVLLSGRYFCARREGQG